MQTKILVGKPEEKRLLGKAVHRWEDNIKTVRKEMGVRVWTGMNWTRRRYNGGLLLKIS